MPSTAIRIRRSADPRPVAARPVAATRHRSGNDRQPNYAGWSIEELRALAAQLQLPDAQRKSRSELLGIFDVTTR